MSLTLPVSPGYFDINTIEIVVTDLTSGTPFEDSGCATLFFFSVTLYFFTKRIPV